MSEANKDSENHVALAAESPEAGRSSTTAHTKGRWPDPVHTEFLQLRRSDDFKYRSKKWLRKTARAAIASATGEA